MPRGNKKNHGQPTPKAAFPSLLAAQDFARDQGLTPIETIAEFLRDTYGKPISRNRVDQILKRAENKIRLALAGSDFADVA